MPHALDGRPLLARLQARVRKYEGATATPLAVDIALHQQSAEEITRLTAEVEAVRADAEIAAKKLRSAEICHLRAVNTLIDEARHSLAKYLPKGWPITATEQQ
ncbi:hypothetical protein HX882_12290 [Pseudomonas gingeri]|uniref:Uncharacterized protein n=1 Tax=Pseudomonas gingeri TaxID=117681 RepID=A0A7Y7XDB6_9PSED|nr:hypothetical protein [Pseudomonas gingeri]NWB96673.1 hypothetical protein [Pseudomonas gingeri]